MAERRTKYHFIYKTTHIKSGRYYIGMHSTFDLYDGYMGSGKLIQESIRKYGEHKHFTEILHYAKSRKGLVALEAEIVTEALIKDPLCMNMKQGGHGGFAGEKHKKKFMAAGKRKRKVNQIKRRTKKRVAERKSRKKNVDSSDKKG